MIILRYFTREILVATLVISGGLLLLTVGNRFSGYLNDAINGDLAADVVFLILALRIPDLLMLILPICFFLSVLVAYGRLHMDSEMVVLSSCGFSKMRLVAYTMVPAAIVAAVVTALTMFISPYTKKKADDIIVQQRNRSELEILTPGRFQPVRKGDTTTYFFERFSPEGDRILNVFIAERPSLADEDKPVSVIRAAAAGDEINFATGDRYMVLSDGYQYLGRPGYPDYKETRFESFGQFLPARQIETAPIYREEYASLGMLLEMDRPEFKAELQWRLSLPLFVFVVALIAVPLSHTNPRRGRFLKMFPGFLVAIFYLGGLTVAKSYVEQERISAAIGVWWVHGIFLAIALLLLLWNNGQALGRFGAAPRRSHPEGDSAQA
ncbi:LPS export ABC transporter permease LptF [Gilvimarinus sp. F26214L]|uniref:LPS export ABC transporter permease LptF n=1 Tax=Gilvimarinus sp. DZF01 TaxID=3461371 RepID=UPI0040452618